VITIVAVVMVVIVQPGADDMGPVFTGTPVTTLSSTQSAPSVDAPSDFALVWKIGQSMVDTKAANSFEVKGALKLFIGSVNPADAQVVAGAACDALKVVGAKKRKVETYLVVGDRPSAVCTSE
jgi:hypothetical protein